MSEYFYHPRRDDLRPESIKVYQIHHHLPTKMKPGSPGETYKNTAQDPVNNDLHPACSHRSRNAAPNTSAVKRKTWVFGSFQASGDSPAL